MEITDIKIRRIYQENRLRALVSITIEGELAVHDIKVIEGPERLFVAMPSRRDDNGTFRDIVHPITSTARQQIENQILAVYHAYLQSSGTNAQPDSDNPSTFTNFDTQENSPPSSLLAND